MATARKYIDGDQMALLSGQDVSVWVVEESVPNTFEDTITSTDMVRVTADLVPAQEQEFLEDEQRKGGSRSATDQIAGRIDHGTLEMERYFKPDTPGTAPEGALLNKAVFGGQRMSGKDSGVADDILTIVSHTRDLTHVTVTSSANYEVGDACALRVRSGNEASSGNAAGVVRFVDAVDSGGANRVRFAPGFPNRPVAGAGTGDQLQGGIVWYLTTELTSTYSLLVKDAGAFTYALSGSAVEGLSCQLDGRSNLKITHTVGFRRMLTTGRDQIRGDSTWAAHAGDSFLVGDTILTVGSTHKFQVGSLVNLVNVASGATEVKAEVTNVDHANSQITLIRGTSPISGANIRASLSAAGPFDTTGVPTLRIALDNRHFIDVTITAGAGTTAATLAGEINAALTASRYYGYNVVGNVAVDWTTVAQDAAGTLELDSPLWGTQSRIEVLDAGSGSAHTAIFGGVQDVSGAEFQIVPWDPGEAESGTIINNKVAWCYVAGFQFGITSLTYSVTNNVTWLEDEKIDDDYAAGFVVSGKRTVEMSLEGYMRAKDASLFYRAENRIKTDVTLQVGKTAGATWAAHCPNTLFNRPTGSGDAERRFQATSRAVASSVLEDETVMASL